MTICAEAFNDPGLLSRGHADWPYKQVSAPDCFIICIGEHKQHLKGQVKLV